MTEEIKSLEQLLARLGKIEADSGRVSLGDILDQIGSRSFGPLLLLSGVALASPLSGIPGMATTMGIFVLLIAVQLPRRRSGRSGLWVPQLLRRRSVPQDKLEKALGWLQRPARAIDGLLRPRLTMLVNGVGASVIAMVCALLALFMPIMELAPFSASAAGTVLAAFGLALIVHDGVLAVFALVLTLVTIAIVAKALL